MAKKQTFIRGTSTHRRTESDYMGTMLEAVTLDDWCAVVKSTLTAAKQGDAPARAFLAQYLVGRAGHCAPAPLEVMTQRLTGRDTLAERIAKPHIDRMKYPDLCRNDDDADDVRDAVADELRALASAQHSPATTGEEAALLRRVK